MTYRLYQGDCLDVLPTLAGVDAVVTDPPYGIGKNNIVPFVRTERNSKGRTGAGDFFDWDETKKTTEVIAASRIAKVAVIWGGNYYADVLPAARCWFVWDKLNSGNFSDFEMAWTSLDSASKMFRYMWNGMIKRKPETRYHPTQKPLDLMRWCVCMATKPGDTVLDPFMGSGTTGVACRMEGRNFIGIELDPHYYAIAERRIANAQPPLFAADAPAVPSVEQATVVAGVFA